jgi:hypothetical protein
MAEVLYMDGDTPQEQCLEKKVYYKVISGAFAYRIQRTVLMYSLHRTSCVNLDTYLL